MCLAGTRETISARQVSVNSTIKPLPRRVRATTADDRQPHG